MGAKVSAVLGDKSPGRQPYGPAASYSTSFPRPAQVLLLKAELSSGRQTWNNAANYHHSTFKMKKIPHTRLQHLFIKVPGERELQATNMDNIGAVSESDCGWWIRC